MTSNQADIRFDVPLYTVAEAARAVGVHPSTLSTWAKGYVRHSPGRQSVRGEAIVTSLQSDNGQPSIPFVGLAEALVLAGIRKSGVPLQRVRPALAALSSEIGIEPRWPRGVCSQTEPRFSSITLQHSPATKPR